MEGVLVVILIIFLAVFMLSAFKMLWIYQMPEDKWSVETIIPKLVFVFVIVLSGFITILLPLDVREQRTTGTGLTDSYSAVYIIIVVFCIAVIPLAMMLYEALGDAAVGLGQKLPFMILRLILFAGFFFGLVGLMFAFFNTCLIPVRVYSSKAVQWDLSQVTNPVESSSVILWSATNLSLSLRFDIYLIAFVTFVGYFLFIAFGGVGLTALPLDMILAFADRPRAIDLATYTRQKQDIGEQARGLGQSAKEMQEKEKSLRVKTGWTAARQKAALRTEFNMFRQSVYLLEIEFRKIEIALKNKGEHPLIAGFKLLAGIVFFAIAIAWWLHIFLYMTFTDPNNADQPVSLFLNKALMYFDDGSGYIMSFFIFAILTLYLLCSVVKGAFKVGMRLFLLPMHPMKEGDTPINSLLFNSMIVMFSSGAIAQFSYTAFAVYARQSTAQVIFAGQIQYLTFYQYFFVYHVFTFMFLAWSLLAFFAMLLYPREKAAVRIKRLVDQTLKEEGLTNVKDALKTGSMPGAAKGGLRL